MFAHRIPLPDALDDTRHRLYITATRSMETDEESNKDLFSELLRARCLGHLQALHMPDGLGRTPIDAAVSVHAIRCMAWSMAPTVDVRRVGMRLPSLKTLAYLRLSTKELYYARSLGITT